MTSKIRYYGSRLTQYLSVGLLLLMTAVVLLAGLIVVSALVVALALAAGSYLMIARWRNRGNHNRVRWYRITVVHPPSGPEDQPPLLHG